MDRVIVRPERLDLDSPGRRDYWVALEHDSIWGDHLMPLTVFVGPEAKDGEGLVVRCTSFVMVSRQSTSFAVTSNCMPRLVSSDHKRVANWSGFLGSSILDRYTG